MFCSGIVFARSQCTKCGHNIKSYENIPLLSYILMMVEYLNGERKARRKVRMDGGTLVVDNAVSGPKSPPSAYTYRLPRAAEEEPAAKPAV